ncbi:hypothetical protein [Frankia sp. CiP1_Cm_nod2]|uniref:hypothetical protein n=1 Tax=Frankia sp. CiP1_Cm_nod2 TaxID=2897161 RepID=UPI002024EED2
MADGAGMADGGPPRPGLLVLTVRPGPRGGLIARLRMTTDVSRTELTAVTTASPTEVVDLVRRFLDQVLADWSG